MPMGLDDPTTELVVNNIAFPQEGVIEINYSEKRKHSDYAGVVETIYIDIDRVKIGRQVSELVDLAREIIDEGQLAIRRPPLKFNQRGRSTGGGRVEEEDDSVGDDDDVEA